jgi:Zn-dependent peptidase ImmA (M78 family)
MANNKISNIAAVGEAFRLWRRYGFADPSELVLEDLALAHGVLVLEAPLDSAEARLLRKGSSGLIRISDRIPEPGRKRFAVAHELGHWFLHAKISQVLACTSEDMLAKYKGSDAEIEANYFAAELLMPKKMFIQRVGGKRPSVALLKQEAGFFLTTLTATAFRWMELTDEYCAVVFSEGGKIRWWTASEALDGIFWLDAGAALSPYSLAGAYFKNGVAATAPERVDAEAWVEDTQRLGESTLIEEIFVMERYGQVMSLLCFP